MIATASGNWNTKKVSEYTGIPVATLTTWRCLGRGPAYFKTGRLVRYRPEDVEAWLQRNKITPETAEAEA